MIVLDICTLHIPNCIGYKIMHITCTLYLHVLSTIFSTVPQLSTWRPSHIPQWHERDGFFAREYAQKTGRWIALPLPYNSGTAKINMVLPED